MIRHLPEGIFPFEDCGYARQPLQMIMSVVSNRELPKLEQIIHGIDPESFMVVSRVSEVRGRGFTLSKHYPN